MSYIVNNGQIQVRQKDRNVPTYRIIPYKSSINPTKNDYFTNTVDELQKQIIKHKNDYRNLIQTMWKIFSEVDNAQYDPCVMFMNCKAEEIYDKISLIRCLNAYQPEEQSLKLSAIVKNEQNPTLQRGETTGHNTSCQNIQQLNLTQEINLQSLYQIQEEEQFTSNSSKLQMKNSPCHKKQTSSTLNGHIDSNKHCRRISVSQLSGQKRESRRTSFLLKEKLSLAFQQQQQLRQILEEQLQKLTKQLDQKNQYLSWTVDELKMRNSMVQKLKDVLIMRDRLLQIQQNELQTLQERNTESRNHQRLEQKDRQIGSLINQLIERAQQTVQDIQLLTRSLYTQNFPHQQQQEVIQSVEEVYESIDLDQIVCLAKSELDANVATSGIADDIAVSQNPNEFARCETSLEELNVLQPKKMNFDQSEKMTLLTKQHFLQAQKKSTQNFVISNVKMIQSLNVATG